MNEIASTPPARRTLDDWLSPILVKELRQGMRSRVFVLFFLLIQVFLFMLMLGNVAAQDDRRTIDTQNVFFWIIVGFALLVLMPLRGLGAIASETKIRTMETILLTRMTAWRVVFGKWSALFGQSLLFVSAVLPYLVLRYFIGGQDVVADFLAMMFMLWLSGVLIAVGIAISGLGNPVMRIIVLIATFIALVNVAEPLTVGFYSGLTAGEVMGLLAIFGFFVPALLFELSASAIAPVSENHAIRRRMLALLFFVSTYVLEKMTRSTGATGMVVPIVVLIGICYYDLAEKPKLQSRMVATMARRGWLGRFAALFLLPGWPSALLFSLVTIPAVMTLIEMRSATNPDWVVLLLAVFGSILPPVFICHIFWPKMKAVLLMVLLYNALIMAVTAFLEAIGGLAEHGIYLKLGKVFAFMPSLPSYYTATVADKATFDELLGWYFVGYSLVTTLFAVLLLVASRRYYSELGVLFRQIRLKPEATEASKPK